MFCAFMYVVNAKGCNFDLLGQSMIALFVMLTSMCAQFEYRLSLLSCGCMCFAMSMRMMRSFAHAIVMMVLGEVLN